MRGQQDGRANVKHGAVTVLLQLEAAHEGHARWQGICIVANLVFTLTLQVKAAYERHAGRQGNDVAGFMRELGFDNFGAAMTSKDSTETTELFRAAIKLTHPSRLNPRQPAARKVMLDAVDCCWCEGDSHICLLPHVRFFGAMSHCWQRGCTLPLAQKGCHVSFCLQT